ncbi:histidine kinase [Chitinibacteraceae bacterium HSL-7]
MRDYWQTRSLLWRLTLALVLLVTPALLALAVGAHITAQTVGGGEAINVAGSLRKQTYLITATALAPPDPVPGSRPALSDLVGDFDRKLSHPALLRMLSPGSGDDVTQAYQDVEARWRGKMLERLRLASSLDASLLLTDAGHFVDAIDRFVAALEKRHEARLARLVALQRAALALMMAVFVGTLWWLHRTLVRPLTAMAGVARRVAEGDFSARAQVDASGEIGALHTAMNRMLDEIARGYSELEARVAEKTAALVRNQRVLAALYRIKAMLSDHDPDPAVFDDVLAEVRELVPLTNAAICVTEPSRDRAFKIAAHDQSQPRAGCLDQDCATCIEHAASLGFDGDLVLPLNEGGMRYGVMPLTLADGAVLERWQHDLLDNVASHVASALAQTRRKQTQHRLALLEERSIIARELHDSLAQALSYLKIQVARLQAASPELDGQARDALTELREGLSAAYRQLRELLTTFRLQVDGGLDAALAETVAEFSRRGGLAIDLVYELTGAELAAGEEIHVLQIVREALANVVHHAQARKVVVRLAWQDQQVSVSIRDDGVGIAPSPEKKQHYGLQIMRDRATMLGGSVGVESASPSGTIVTLSFKPVSPYTSTDKETLDE